MKQVTRVVIVMLCCMPTCKVFAGTYTEVGVAAMQMFSDMYRSTVKPSMEFEVGYHFENLQSASFAVGFYYIDLAEYEYTIDVSAIGFYHDIPGIRGAMHYQSAFAYAQLDSKAFYDSFFFTQVGAGILYQKHKPVADGRPFAFDARQQTKMQSKQQMAWLLALGWQYNLTQHWFVQLKVNYVGSSIQREQDRSPLYWVSTGAHVGVYF